MTLVRVAIATPSMIDHARLAKVIEQSIGFELVGQTSDLSATYSKVEELMPDVVLIAASFSFAQEYSCMLSLFDAVETLPITIESHGVRTAAELPLYPRAPAIHTGLGPDEIIAHIKAALQEKSAHQPSQTAPAQMQSPSHFAAEKIILIGASTGGIDALTTLLAHFPKNCPPTAIVQHTGQNFRQTLSRLLARRCQAEVAQAETGLAMKAGRICLAGGTDGHLHLSQAGGLSCLVQRGPATSGHMPSIDELFLSAVPLGARVMAVLLTGMGRDGATGLLSLRRAGAATIGQDEASSVVYGMARVAFEMGAVQQQLPLHRIGPAILQWASAPHMRAQLGRTAL